LFMGRRDNQVKIRGFRIEPGEIEAVLRGHSAVDDCAVLAKQNATTGEKNLVAYCAASCEVTESDLQRWIREKLPEQMAPSRIVLVERLPLTSNGKVDRAALSRIETPGFREAEFLAPRAQTEELIAGIWAKTLGVERVGREDDFFALGGHSLLATRVTSRIRETFNIDLPLSALFEHSSLTDMAEQVEQALRSGIADAAEPIAPVSRDGDLPLSFAQQRLWFLSELEPGSAFYNIPIAVRMNGNLNAEVLERTFNEIIRRHEVLRTVFEARDGQPVQLIIPAADFKLEVIDLSDRPRDERESAALELASQEAQRPFDLRHGPLFRLALLKLDEEEHIAMATLHHIVSDGWSSGILMSEVGALYEAFLAGRPSPLHELSIQYADYAAWQRNWLQGPALEDQLGFWRTQLEGLSAFVLPTDHPRPPVQTYGGSHQTITLSRELSESLKRLRLDEGMTLYMVMLAAFYALLHRYSGETDVVVGTPVAGRNRIEIEPLIGFFVNTLVMRVDLDGSPCFSELLQHVYWPECVLTRIRMYRSKDS